MATREIQPGLPIGIGSLPHPSAAEALDVILRTMPGSPHWPQLPNRSFLEQMEHQFSGFLPGVVIDESSRKMVVEVHSEGFHSSLERFYEQVLSVESGGEPDHFGLTDAFAPGFFAFESRLAGNGRPVVKGHCTGPFTLGLALLTTDDRAILYDDNMGDVVVKAVANHARWQARRLGRLGDLVIVSVDEPILTSFGSTAMITVTRQQVVSALAETVDALHAEGAIASVHCCGNTDWSLFVDAGMDMLLFDAWEFADKMELYRDSVEELFGRGGWLGWGIVPLGPELRDATPEVLLERLRAAQDGLSSRGLDRGLVAERTVITPACGAGPIGVDDAVRVYELTSDLSSLYAAG